MFLFQSAGPLVNEHLVELLALEDARRRQSRFLTVTGAVAPDEGGGYVRSVQQSRRERLVQPALWDSTMGNLRPVGGLWPELQVVSPAPQRVAVIRCIMEDGSIHDLF